jgi:hypothetical protein
MISEQMQRNIDFKEEVERTLARELAKKDRIIAALDLEIA